MADDLFHVVDDMQIVLRGPKGVYQQTKAYHRGGKLYAGWGKGFIRLLASGGTSHPNVSWESMEEHPLVSRTATQIEFRTVDTVPRTIEQKTIEALASPENCDEDSYRGDNDDPNYGYGY